MPRYYVRQPNGKIGLFSTITDDWIYKDLTEEEFYEVFCERNGKHTFDIAIQYVDKWTDYAECEYYREHSAFWIGYKVKNYTQEQIVEFVKKTGYE